MFGCGGPVPSAHRPQGEPQYLSVHRGFPHQPVTVHERFVHPARISRNFLSSTVLVDCRGRGQVTACERHWYCAWLCQTCSTKTQWCYDFSSIHTSCRVFVEILHGCEKAKEYKWYAGCFGWVSACLSGRTRCFNDRLTSTGACSTSVCSAPEGPIE